MKKKKEEVDEEQEDCELNCSECKKDFGDDETIFECNDCDEIFCKRCLDTHLDEEVEDILNSYENDCCNACGGLTETMYDCEKCDERFCEDCESGHIEKEKEDIETTEWEKEDYIREKVAEKL